MDLLDAHRSTLDRFDRLVRQISDHQWDAPTPCAEWTVRDLVNHLVYEQLWAPELLTGKTLDEVGDRFDGDMLGDHPVSSWAAASAAARTAWTAPGALNTTVHTSAGVTSATEYGWQMVVDLAVHGWDLAVALGAPHPIDEKLARRLIEFTEPQAAGWQGAGIFAPPVPVSADADPPARLIALLGRDPAWRP